MKAMNRIRMRPRTLASVAAVTVGAIVLTGFALTYDGDPTAEVDLHDGGVWVTKGGELLVGHFNHESTVLDGGLRATGDDFDILQDGADVVVVDSAESTAARVDPAHVSMQEAVSIPVSAEVSLGGPTTAILDADSGDLWVLPTAALNGFDIAAVEPTAELGPRSAVAVGRDGTVHAVSADDGEIVTIPVAADGSPEEPRSTGIGPIGQGAAPTITAVGEVAVVLSPADGEIITSDGVRADIEAADTAVLQQPSGASDVVTIATASELIRVPLEGGEVRSTSTGLQGAPAAPVSVLGCVYGAWNGSGAFVRECADGAASVNETVPGLTDAAELTFRVNRDVVVLNDAVGGATWLPDETLRRVDDWDVLTPPQGEADDDQETSEETVETTLPERTEVNSPPEAEDDAFGVRPGRTAILPAVDNDNDPDGDVLAASLAGDQPSIGTVQPIYDGGSLQITVDDDARGTATFQYQVDDGRGGTDTATVTLTVVEPSSNRPPEPRRQTVLTVETGGVASYDILPDWIDPDGDDVYLQSVSALPGDEVDVTSDGQVTYRAVATAPGRHEVTAIVADAHGEQGTASVVIDVRPADSTLPTTNADHIVTGVGQQVTVRPLANDSSSGREQLRLTRVEQEGGSDAELIPDFPNKAFSFRAERAGVYYIKYLVAAGPNAVPGLVRVDVREPGSGGEPPIAVRDVALLPKGGEVLLGVLGNDTDPAGGVLVVQSVTAEPDSGLSVSVLDHEMLRIGDQGALDEQVRLTYRVSNGTRSAEGEVVVIPIPAPQKLLPPVAVDDEAVVRAGDVVDIPVLDNDSHPNGDAIHVAPELVEPLVDPADGEIFVSQDEVRFKAGDQAKTVYATYQVVDSQGQKDAGLIRIRVVAVDEENNAAPRPQDLTARTLNGSVVNVAVPLDGIDPDGDSVELIGIDSRPQKGRVLETADGYFVYEAFDDASGVDVFRYRVRDRLGSEATATVSIGIAPGEDVNQAPYAVQDAVVVRPGREVAIPVLLNDSDPDGERISLVRGGIIAPDGLEARVSGDRVLIEAPERAGETSLQYTIVDERGAEATAVVRITIEDDVPLLPPIARDDRVLMADVDSETLTAAVDVLANDEDPDGVTAALDVVVGDGGELAADGTVSVALGERSRLVRYTVTDPDGLEASAFIAVPAVQGLRPTLSSTEPVVVEAGETVVLPLDEYVTVAGGGSVVLTEAAKVGASHADGADLIRDERTLVYTPAADYFGPDGLTFEVTDGTGPDDPDGRRATLTIPITVLPPENQQPSFTRGELTVAAGEPAASIDLQALTTDPDVDDTQHDFEVIEQPGAGLTATIDGGILSVEAAGDAQKGTTATVRLRVSDGETDPIEGEVDVRVIASTRELATANTDTVDEAAQGRELVVPVLENDTNPFPDTPLEIVGAVTETGAGLPVIDGDSIRITPGDDFVGTLIVRYTVQDATGDPDRQVDGEVVITVQGAPDAPGAPQVSSVQDRTVVVSFTAPADNGAEIERYTVTSTTGRTYAKECASTTCTLDGLTNNVEYAFQVTATNRVGESDPSPVSEVVRPDARPDTPDAPVLAFGDASLSVRWQTPTTPGSPVESYTLQISPAPPSGQAERTATGNSMVWEGLENGASYQVRIRAHNRAPEPSSWSEWSLDEVPAGAPDQPAAPTTERIDAVGTQAQIRVNWDRPKDNGDALDGYQLQILQGGSLVRTLTPDASATSQAVPVTTSETDYTFRIRAQNKAGWGDWSAASAPRRAINDPGAPTNVVATAGDNAVSVSFTPGARNGAAASEITYQYRVNQGAWRSDWDGRTVTGSQVANNGAYRIQLRAVATVDGSSFTGTASSFSNEVAPSGPPGKPGVAGRTAGMSVEWAWTVPDRNGSDIRVRWREDGPLMNGSTATGAWSAWSSWNPGDGAITGGGGEGATYRLVVQVQDREGRTAEGSAEAVSGMPLVETYAHVSKGGAYTTSNCNSTCNYLRINTDPGFPAGTYTVTCLEEGEQFPPPHVPFDMNLAAGTAIDTPCWHGLSGATPKYVTVSLTSAETGRATTIDGLYW